MTPGAAYPVAHPINVAWFRGTDPRPVVGPDVVTWDRLAARLCRFPIVACEKRAAPGWAPFVWAPGAARRRQTDAVGALSALVLDFDSLADLEQLRAAAAALGAAAVVHTSWSHRPNAPKARLVVPLARPVAAAAWPATWAAADRWARSHALVADAACRDVARFYLLPGLPSEADDERRTAATAWRFDGAPLDPGELSRAWPAPAPPVRPSPAPRPAPLPTRDELDRDRRRADHLLEARTRAIARDFADGAPIGRRLYGVAADVVRLDREGLAEASRWRPALVAAGVAAGLSEHEAARVVAAGMARAERDGLRWTWPD